MATANDILVRARRRIGIHANEEAYEAAEQQADFDVLTDMLNQWAIDSIISSFTATGVASTVTLTFADSTTMTDEANLGVSANLSLRLSGQYGVQLPADVVLDAEQGLKAILRKQHLASDVAESSYDKAISHMPSQRTYNGAR